MTRCSIPGEARVRIAIARLPAIRNVIVAGPVGELRIDAILDTDSTYCVIPEQYATGVGYTRENHLGTQSILGVAGQRITIDHHRLEYIQAGTARAYEVDFLVGDRVE